MCGIIGCINYNTPLNKAKMLADLVHRGPNDSGYYDIGNSSFIGHARLSIIDTTYHGHQPMISRCENYILVYNGEIYNHNDLREELISKGYSFESNSDSEVLLNLFIEYGADEVFLNKLRGMFAFCIYNRKDGSLFLARDRFGIKPLIYGFKEKMFYFSSELKPLHNANIISKELDEKSLADYMQYGCVYQPNTIYEEAKQLMPGSFMKVDKDNACQIKKYYTLSDKIENLDLSYEDTVKQLREKLEDATKYHMIADVEVGAFLSGGVDSTATVALMKKYSTKKISTFSIGFVDTQTEVVDELTIAKKTAEILDTNHHEIRITDSYIDGVFDDFILAMDQPSVDGLNTYIVSKETSKYLKVAITGLGGDEIFAGYPHFERFNRYSESKSNIFTELLVNLNAVRPNRYLDKFQYFDMTIEQMIDRIRSLDKESFVLKNKKTNRNLSKIQRISICELDDYMLNILLRDNDDFSMDNSLEVRPILLDHPLVEFAVSLNDKYKIDNGVLKSIFIDAVKDIIPEFVYDREKSGFVMPVVGWMNTILNDRFKLLLDSNYESFLGVEYLEKLEYRVRNKSVVQKDWKVFVLLAWLKKNEIEIV